MQPTALSILLTILCALQPAPGESARCPSRAPASEPAAASFNKVRENIRPRQESTPLERALATTAPRLVSWRRDIHAHPELGEREGRTAALVATQLRALGLEVQVGIGATGVTGLLRGAALKSPDASTRRPLVAWRADMDALPITEQTGLPFASTARDTWDGTEVGVMHACGHDMHTAIGLGVATALAQPAVRQQLANDILFIFQPAEEGVKGSGVHGAERMLAEGIFETRKPDSVFGLHVNPKIPLGHVSLHDGGAMAAVDRFTIEITGKQVHGAYPESGVDPIVVASQLVLALQTIPSRSISTHDQVVLTVGKFAAGNRFNIIPNSAELVGTIRTHSRAVQLEVHRRLRELVATLPAGFGASGTVTIEELTPVTVNDAALVASARPLFTRLLGPDGMTPEPPHMGGEDFAFFAQQTPGLYFFLGVSDFTALEPGTEPAMVHTPDFNPDERALELGLRLACELLLQPREGN
ncbi:MAG TPA: amidohydrolase [Planctomycetota bacterium]|nr:amidohydrolase [Planctomycetota bacterium]